MESHEKEFLLYRILNGFIKYKDTNLIIKSPTKEILYKASEIYLKFYNLSINEGIMTNNDILNYLIKLDKWTEENEKQLNEDLPKQIEHFKEELFRAYYQSDRKKTIRKYLDTARQEYNRLNNIRHSFDHISCAGVANYAKLQYIIENCTFYKNKLYNWSRYSPYLLMSFFQEKIIEEEKIRELSHNHPWYIIWQVGKKIGNVFNRASVDLSFDEQRLVMWSILYDNVNEQSEAPPQDVIDDDDALDGWLSIKRKEKGENTGNISKNEKINNANEIFIPASNLEDARKVDNLNSNYAKTIKKQRFSFVKEKGQVSEQDLPDIKQQLMMEQNRRSRGG